MFMCLQSWIYAHFPSLFVPARNTDYEPHHPVCARWAYLGTLASDPDRIRGYRQAIDELTASQVALHVNLCCVVIYKFGRLVMEYVWCCRWYGSHTRMFAIRGLSRRQLSTGDIWWQAMWWSPTCLTGVCDSWAMYRASR